MFAKSSSPPWAEKQVCWPRLAGEDTWEGRALGWDPPHEVELGLGLFLVKRVY